jgi:hypothetical protein
MNKTQAIEFDKLFEQIESVYLELGKLSHKNPDGVINPFKLKIINGLIANANLYFQEDNLPINGFTSFDEDQIPSNSDVVFIFSQYLNKLDFFKFQNTEFSLGSCYWILEGKEKSIQTRPPKYLKVAKTW